MNTKRFFQKALFASLTTLTVLPLTACTPESINAVTGLLKNAAVSQSAAGSTQSAGATQNGPADRPVQTRGGAGLQVDASANLGIVPGAPRPSGAPGTQPGTQPTGQGRPPVDPQPQIQGEKPQPVMAPCARAIVKIRFGQFRSNPASPLTAWKGGLKIENGKMKLLHTIQFEKGDMIGMGSDTELGWQTVTRPHYDGFVVMLKASPDAPEPRLILHTSFGDKVFTYSQLAHLNEIKRVDRFGNQFQIQAYLLPPKPDSCGDDATIQEDPAYAYPDENQEVVEDQTVTDTPATEPTEASVTAAAEVSTASSTDAQL